MQYQGGKHFEAGWISGVLKAIREPGQPYWEPFCGACSVMARMDGERIASDAHKSLIMMWKAVQKGWQPKIVSTVEQYHRLKTSPDSPQKGFTGFAQAFGGKYFGGFAGSRGSSGKSPGYYFGAGVRSVSRKIAKMKNVVFLHGDYRVAYRPARSCLIYCDPPYNETHGYDGAGAFSNDEFWDWVRMMSQRHTVLVSSFEAPHDFVSVSHKETATTMYRNRRDVVIEHLFAYNG